MDKEEILKKVREREEKKEFVGRCLSSSICPECGENCFPKGSDHPFLTEYKCTKCNYKILLG